MFRSFFTALTNLTAAVNALAASFTEANANFRERLALDYHGEDQPEQLEQHEPADTNGTAKRKRVARS